MKQKSKLFNSRNPINNQNKQTTTSVKTIIKSQSQRKIPQNSTLKIRRTKLTVNFNNQNKQNKNKNKKNRKKRKERNKEKAQNLTSINERVEEKMIKHLVRI